MPKITLTPLVDETTYGHPVIGQHPGPCRTQLMSDPGGLPQFGAVVEELHPGSLSAAPAHYLVIGARHPRDRIHYSDHDPITERDDAMRRYLRRDGTPHMKGDRPE